MSIAGGSAGFTQWLAEGLTEIGHSVHRYPTGAAAIEGLGRHPANVLFIALDVADGPPGEIGRKAQRWRPGLAVLFFSEEETPRGWDSIPPGAVLLWGRDQADLTAAIALAVFRLGQTQRA